MPYHLYMKVKLSSLGKHDVKDLSSGNDHIGYVIVSKNKTGYKLTMVHSRLLPLSLIFLMTAFVAGCGRTAPYVYDAGEFNRDTDAFRNGIKDRKTVSICYAKRATTPAQITKLAGRECARFGKIARFSRQSYLECPVLTPVAAIFDCLSTDADGKLVGQN